MRGDHKLEPISHGVHHIGVLFVDLVEAPLEKNVVKDRSHETGLINLWLGSCGKLMNSQEVQQDNHIMGHKRQYGKLTLFTSI